MISVLIEKSVGDCGSPEKEYTTQPGVEEIVKKCSRKASQKREHLIFKGK